jgi:histidinol phosphatase-like PHP family hydrolase
VKYVLLGFVAGAAACAGPDVVPPTVPASPMPQDAPLVSQLIFDAPPGEEPPPMDAAPPEAAQAPEVWLKGSTHVHAKPSGDSSEPIDDVFKWYEAHGYDFIALTDHNRVSEAGFDTRGRAAVRAGAQGLIVLSGIELTHNPSGCLPIGDKSKKCRIHVNVLGVTARPAGKIEWAERHSHQRLDMYQAALSAAKALGGRIVQINHPQWFWGMTADLLAELARRHALLVEIHNAQFLKWSNGDKDHPSMDALWDAVLARGLTMWGVASDDAHDYRGKHGKYPAGGAWIVVKARRDPQAILDAMAVGHFYASDGVVLDHAEVDAGELVVEVAPNEQGSYAIDWIANGKVIETVKARSARHAIPQGGYIRAVVTRDDGKQAWVEPARL